MWPRGGGWACLRRRTRGDGWMVILECSAFFSPAEMISDCSLPSSAATEPMLGLWDAIQHPPSSIRKMAEIQCMHVGLDVLRSFERSYPCYGCQSAATQSCSSGVNGALHPSALVWGSSILSSLFFPPISPAGLFPNLLFFFRQRQKFTINLKLTHTGALLQYWVREGGFAWHGGATDARTDGRLAG